MIQEIEYVWTNSLKIRNSGHYVNNKKELILQEKG